MRLSNNHINQLCTLHDPGLRKHFNKVSESYKQEINLAIYMDLDSISELQIFQIIDLSKQAHYKLNRNSSNSTQTVYIHFYAFRLSRISGDLMYNQLFKLFIRQLDTILRNQQYVNKKYSILFFNEPSEKSTFDILKDIYKKLPAIYFLRLNKIYLIEPGFMDRQFGGINFTKWSKMFAKYITHVQSIEQIQEIQELKVYNVLCKCPKEITSDVKLICENTNTEKGNNRNIVIQKTLKPHPFELLKKQLYQHPYNQNLHVPLLLSILIETMKANQAQYCVIQGIFRSAGSIQDEQQLLKYAYNLKTFRIFEAQEYCPKAIAGVIKKMFTQAVTPLIPYQIYNQILNLPIVEEKNVVELWKKIIKQLPQINKNILCYIVEFLRQYIIEKKNLNKMNEHNLSVVFNPCFFRSKQPSYTDLFNSGRFAALFKHLLEKYYEIFQGKKMKEVIKNNQKIEYQSEQGCCFMEIDQGINEKFCNEDTNEMKKQN